ncbi:hypothetical protein KJ903_04790 [Patescibacteria group bacterium]|nr:hypothetical protein [Patescibacteria group bacterium]
MKTWQKISTLSGVSLGMFMLIGVAAAATSDVLQPAATVTINEEFVVDNTGRFNSVYIGEQGTGGVTFFNGTIINNTTEGGTGNPVTFGDDIRVDGAIWRSTANDGGTSPVKVYDDLTVNGNITGNFVYSDNLVHGQNVQAAYSLFALDMRLTPYDSGAVGDREVPTENDPASSAYDSDGNLRDCASDYYGYMIFSTNPIGSGGANQFYGCTADGWKEL